MIQRPKSVSFVAISFAAIAISFAYFAWRRLLAFQSRHGTHDFLWTVFLAALSFSLFSDAYGLWKLSANSRIPGVFLSCILTALVICSYSINKTFWPEFWAQEAPELAGGILALIALPSWILSPIYILTRPTIRNAFKERNVA
jgi:hypothetical protein